MLETSVLSVWFSTDFEVSVQDASKVVPSSPLNAVQVNAIAWKGGGAGGFGPGDDINSFLPIASDWTDFEASIGDDGDYREP
ncbi:hypothetical protein REPUB_Repub18cG0058100 [Reevesia pubescens]